MIDDPDEPSAAAKLRLAELFIGKIIGWGCYRKVYRLQDGVYDKVIKIEEGTTFSNVKEWEFWDQVHHSEKFSKWLAPCKWISPNGQVLIQMKTTPVLEKYLPKMVPSLFWDLKADNWGWYKGRVVCHDYANFDITHNNPWKMKKANWK